MTDQHVADPFDLPDWIGARDSTWTALGSVGGTKVAGLLTSDVDGEDPLHDAVSLTLLAADVAYPAPVLSETVRSRSHQAWTHGEVLLVCQQGRFALAVPGTAIRADLLCEAMARFARAVGSEPDRMTVCLRL